MIWRLDIAPFWRRGEEKRKYRQLELRFLKPRTGHRPLKLKVLERQGTLYLVLQLFGLEERRGNMRCYGWTFWEREGAFAFFGGPFCKSFSIQVGCEIFENGYLIWFRAERQRKRRSSAVGLKILERREGTLLFILQVFDVSYRVGCEILKIGMNIDSDLAARNKEENIVVF